MKTKYIKDLYQEGYKLGKYVYNKGISASHKFIKSFSGENQGKMKVHFEEDIYFIDEKGDTILAINDNDMEIIIGEYIKRKKELKKINK